MYYMYLLMRQCYLQLVVVHHLVADRRQEELLVLLQPWACLVVHGHGHSSLFKAHCEFVLAFRCHNRRVVRAELIQRKLRTDRIALFSLRSSLHHLLGKIFQFLHLLRAHLLLEGQQVTWQLALFSSFYSLVWYFPEGQTSLIMVLNEKGVQILGLKTFYKSIK